MSCPCDTFEFPPIGYIPAGLSRLPRQIATFPEFRSALLHDIALHPALAVWRGRQQDDFGVMLLEMWAYVCDVTSFYDEVFAHECYVRTARQRSSLRQLTGLLGYLPRPAVGAAVDLSAFADGRKAITLTAGTAFRSGAFKGNPPQVFELTADTGIHPLSNQWQLNPVRPDTFGTTTLTQDFLLCLSGTVSLKTDNLVLVKAGGWNKANIVKAVSSSTGKDAASYTKVQFNDKITIPSDTKVASVRLQKPTNRATLTMLKAGPGEDFAFNATSLYLDSIYRQIRSGQDIIVEYQGNYYFNSVSSVTEVPRTVAVSNPIIITPASPATTVSVTVPPVLTTVTQLNLKSSLTAISTISKDGLDVTVHFGMASAGVVAIEAATQIEATMGLSVPTPVEKPANVDPPSKFQFEDKNGNGVGVGAVVDYEQGFLQLNQGTAWTPNLAIPVRVYGNVVSATRGASVTAEILGAGDASQISQVFKLKQNPLTYLPSPTADNPSGVASTLRVRVDGVLWSEVRDFYGAPADAAIYIVRQNDKQESSVIFGDGVRGQRLCTGAQVVAYYRFGAGAAIPPAGSINQLAKPLPGLKSVRNPVAAYGGDDAEPAEKMRTYAPRSALLLGRAVSLLDLEAAAAIVPGVRAVRAEWIWNEQSQQPVAQIYYIGDPGLDSVIIQRLRNLAELDTPIDVEIAKPLAHTLAIQITFDPALLDTVVLPSVRTALMNPYTGLLAPEQIGIGLPLFRSRIYECVLSVAGAISVAGLQWDGDDFEHWAMAPPSGSYFDFVTGTLLLNGT
jgi:hypothetical protein